MSPMNLAAFYQACQRLIDTGWTIPHIERLCHFRDSFQRTNLDLPDFEIEYDIWNLSAGWFKQAGSPIGKRFSLHRLESTLRILKAESIP